MLSSSLPCCVETRSIQVHKIVNITKALAGHLSTSHIMQIISVLSHRLRTGVSIPSLPIYLALEQCLVLLSPPSRTILLPLVDSD